MTRLEEPIKVRWTGDSRVKWETRTLEPLAADGSEEAELSREVNNRQKTQLVVETEEELEAVLSTLQRHAEFCGPYGAVWGTPAKKKAAERVIIELEELEEGHQ